MGSSSNLASRLDFDRGLEFQEDVRRLFKSPVHHPYPSPDGSFFLLVTFRRFLFRLTEDSVSLALQSCLGGRALDFHVKFLSNNHFRFSVFSKQVGFHVYKLRRVITSSFDCYFHLWNNGTPHWEREKRAWEIEQEKEWTKVLSKNSKKRAAKSQKRVCFDKNLVHASPPKKSPSTQSPQLVQISFGAFSTLTDLSSSNSLFGNTEIVSRSHHDRVLWPQGKQGSSVQQFGEIPAANAAPHQREILDLVSNSKSTVNGPLCSRCSNLGHTSSKCPGRIRCWRCLNFGHTRISCLSRSQPSWAWQPKKSKRNPSQGKYLTSVKPNLVWMPKPTRDKATELLDSHANLSEPLAGDGSINHQQQQGGADGADAMDEDENDNDWPAWNPAVFAADNGLKNKPEDVFFRGSTSSAGQAPIVVDQNAFQPAILHSSTNTSPARTGMEIVPWKPVLDVMALQLWPLIIESRRQARIAEQIASVILLGDVGRQQSPTTSGPEDFEFQMGQMQSNPPREVTQKKHRGCTSTSMALPPSSSSSVTPLVESSVRRSLRVNRATDGFHQVRLEKNPSKKRKTCGAVLIDESTGEAGPIPFAILQGWGIDCGVAPAELSEDALMQAPTSEPVIHDESST